jgi:phosphatidylserine/phosphatidylglycerophosphate/cardiolipin synthase-like enzyme
MIKLIKIFPLSIFLSVALEAYCCEQTYIRNEESKHLYLKEIKEAKQYVIAGTFKLHEGLMPDTEVLNAIKQAVINLASTENKRNNPVKIFLESRLRPSEIRQSEKLAAGSSLKAFEATGANIIKDIRFYDNLHFKVLLTERTAIIGTTNFDVGRPGFVIRDFYALITNPIILKEIKNVLEKVEIGESITWPQYTVSDLKPDESRLSWGPRQHRQHFIELIRLARSIDIYLQDFQDPIIFKALKERLEKHKEKSFSLRILMSEYPFGDKSLGNKSLPHLKGLVKVGAQIRLTGRKKLNNDLPLHIHAKVMLIKLNAKDADNQIMYLGSTNFYGPVLAPEAKDLNVGIITRAPYYINPVQRTFEEDWNLHEGEDLMTF